MPKFIVLLVVVSGCATVAPSSVAPTASVVSKPAPAPAPGVVAPAPVAVEPAAPVAVATPTAPAAAAVKDEDDDDTADAADGEGEVGDEGESHESTGDGAIRYTTDISDAELEKRWKADPASLGSMSVGFVDAGRLVNGLRMPDGKDWLVVTPEKTYGTQETIDYLKKAITAVRAAHPEAPPLRVNQIGAKDGGYLRPHKSHQNGRDVDLAFYYPTVEPARQREREKYINVGLTWALVESLVRNADVQLIFLDRRVQKVLFDYALAHGEDRAWLDSLFHNGHDSLVQHARRHRDHLHVRFFNPRAQELGRRVAPLLAQQPEYNVAMHRVHNGDNLGKIALKYNSTVAAIRKANHMSNNFIRAGITLSIPLRGACTHCPVPPSVIVPPRRLSPQMVAEAERQSKPVVLAVAPVAAPIPAVIPEPPHPLVNENPAMPAPVARAEVAPAPGKNVSSAAVPPSAGAATPTP